jgi:hypothetical protein
VTAIVASIFVVLFTSFGFLLWSSWRAFIAAEHIATQEASALPEWDRRLSLWIGFGGAPFMAAGAVATIVIRPVPGIYKSELLGLAATGGAWLVAMFVLAARQIRHAKQTTTRKNLPNEAPFDR